MGFSYRNAIDCLHRVGHEERTKRVVLVCIYASRAKRLQAEVRDGLAPELVFHGKRVDVIKPEYHGVAVVESPCRKP